MKRLRFSVFISMLCIGIAYNFVLPQTAHAAFESAQVKILNEYSTQESTFQQKYTEEQQTEYDIILSSLKEISLIQSTKEPAGQTDDYFSIHVLQEFQSYLEKRSSTLSNNAKKQVDADARRVTIFLQGTLGPTQDQAEA